MSANVDTVRRAYDAPSQGDIPTVLGILDPNPGGAAVEALLAAPIRSVR